MQLRANASADRFATHPKLTFRRLTFSRIMLARPYAFAYKIVSLSMLPLTKSYRCHQQRRNELRLQHTLSGSSHEPIFGGAGMTALPISGLHNFL